MRNSRSEVIRISGACKRQLSEIRSHLGMPIYYKEGDIVEALVRLVRANLH